MWLTSSKSGALFLPGNDIYLLVVPGGQSTVSQAVEQNDVGEDRDREREPNTD